MALLYFYIFPCKNLSKIFAMAVHTEHKLKSLLFFSRIEWYSGSSLYIVIPLWVIYPLFSCMSLLLSVTKLTANLYLIRYSTDGFTSFVWYCVQFARSPYRFAVNFGTLSRVTTMPLMSLHLHAHPINSTICFIQRPLSTENMIKDTPKIMF